MAEWDLDENGDRVEMKEEEEITIEGELHRVQRTNKEKMYKKIEEHLQTTEIQEYREAYRKLYYEQGIFQNKKSKDLLEKSLQDLNPNLHYNVQTQKILASIAKVYLMELFEEAVETREKMKKYDIDQIVLEEAARSLKEKNELNGI